MPKKILIEKIKIDRELRDGDDLSDLEAAEAWLPIIVNENYELVDGLRRIRSAEKSGAGKILAHVTSTLEEMSVALAEQHTTPVKDWQRVYELVRTMRPYIDKRWREIQANNIRRITGRSLDPNAPQGQSRPYVTKALGGTSAAQWEVVERVFEDDTMDPKLMEEVKAGRLTPSGAHSRAFRAPKQGDITDPEDQQALIKTVAQFMGSAARSLDQLAWPIKAAPEDLIESIDQIRRSRTKITSFLNRQSEEAESK